MAWACLVVAGLLETGWATAMKASHGFTRPGLTLLALGVSIISFVLLAQALKTLPMGTGYAVWTGIGTIGSAVVGVLVFHESLDARRIACIALIAVGIFGLHWTRG